MLGADADPTVPGGNLERGHSAGAGEDADGAEVHDRTGHRDAVALVVVAPHGDGDALARRGMGPVGPRVERALAATRAAERAPEPQDLLPGAQAPSGAERARGVARAGRPDAVAHLVDPAGMPGLAQPGDRGDVERS